MSDDFFLDCPLEPDFFEDVFEDTDEAEARADFFDEVFPVVEVLMLNALALVFGEMGTPSSSTRMMGFSSVSVPLMALSMSAFVNILAKVLKVWTLGGEVEEDEAPPEENEAELDREDDEDDGECPSLVERSSNSMTVAMFISMSPPLTGAYEDEDEEEEDVAPADVLILFRLCETMPLKSLSDIFSFGLVVTAFVFLWL